MKAQGCFWMAMILAACQSRSAPSPFDAYLGSWVLHAQRENVMVLTLTAEGGEIRGALRHPEKFQVDGEGAFQSIDGVAMKTSVLEGTLVGGELRLTLEDQEKLVVKVVDAGHAEVRYADTPEWMASWEFERSMGGDLTLATELPAAKATPEIAALQAKLRAMAAEDQAVRLGARPLESRIVAVDEKHLTELLRIHAQYGWPRQSLIGKEAAHQFWLLVQHQKSELQTKLLPEMDQRVREGEASSADLAFLTDDVLQSQGKLQRFGTNASCGNGKPVLDPVEDPAGLAQRRRELHMEPAEENVRRGDSWCQNFVRDLSKAK